MTIGIRMQTREINARIVEDFYDEPLSVSALCVKYGRSESMVNKLLAKFKRDYGIAHGGAQRERSGKPVDPRLLGGKVSRSLRHFVIGMAVTRYINEHKLSPTAFGMQASTLSRVVVGDIMRGAHDLTITEIEKLAIVLGIPFDTLIDPNKMQTDKEKKLHAVG